MLTQEKKKKKNQFRNFHVIWNHFAPVKCFALSMAPWWLELQQELVGFVDGWIMLDLISISNNNLHLCVMCLIFYKHGFYFCHVENHKWCTAPHFFVCVCLSFYIYDNFYLYLSSDYWSYWNWRFPMRLSLCSVRTAFNFWLWNRPYPLSVYMLMSFML